MTLTVDNPILNSPYREPERYWLCDAAGVLLFVSGSHPQMPIVRMRQKNTRDIECPDRSLGITRHGAEFRPLAAGV